MMKKIGILCKQFNNLRNFELRIINEIINDQDLDLTVLILDERKKNKKNTVFKKLKRENKKGKIFSKIVMKIQEIIELQIFNIKTNPINSEKTKILKTIKQIYVSPETKGNVDFFSKSETDKIREFELDVLLRFEFNIIIGDILDVSKNGIWSFHHGDNRYNRGGPSCFWEIMNKEKNIGVTLQKLTQELDGGFVIDRGTYNKHWSWIKSRQIVQESSVRLLLKNLNKLKSDNVEYIKSGNYYYELYKFPSLFISIRYIIYFYSNIIIRIFKRINSKIFGVRYASWTIMISKGSFLNSVLHKIKKIKLPKNEFWADPFLINYENQQYIYFENYEYSKGKGKISCGKLENEKIIDIVDVLDKPYHLSYPNVFKFKNDLYMIPETHQNFRLEIYKCTSFPNDWELYSTAFEGEQIVDCNLHQDELGKLWLFLNKKELNSDGCSDLYIYQIDSLKLEKIISHQENPVIINSLSARNAGPIFKHENKILRPSQINSEGIYGRGLNINQIETLTLNEYTEKTLHKCFPYFDRKLQGIHHLHQFEDCFATDVCYKKR